MLQWGQLRGQWTWTKQESRCKEGNLQAAQAVKNAPDWNSRRRHPDSNRGSGSCSPLPYHLAMPPRVGARYRCSKRLSTSERAGIDVLLPLPKVLPTGCYNELVSIRSAPPALASRLKVTGGGIRLSARKNALSISVRPSGSSGCHCTTAKLVGSAGSCRY